MQSRNTQYSLETLFKICHDLKQQGRRIATTHGAFDLFHTSHLDLLQQSAAVCDYLIVGVDSDQSITAYKSYKRPIVDQDSRMNIINEIRCVDASFVKHIKLDYSSHINLYKNLKLDFLTIGTKFEKTVDVQYETAKAGVNLLRFETKQDYSTTYIVNKIIEKYSDAQ